ncbi:phage antirepressor KilAC domain-containing protein [Aeromonas enteropelogenes]|uniref:phage antirepressor KilAC domain-containing protein n=1 Tax=Aeromonas enteropelogenes TaxID=29489 RepID=UPI003B9DE193
MNMTALTNPVMSSIEIAELTGKRHDNVMADIRRMLVEIQSPEKSGDYLDGRGRIQPCLLLDKEETICLVSGYSAALRIRIIRRWQELEQQDHQPAMMIPQTLPEALRLAAELAEQKMELERKVALDAPEVAFAKQIASVEKGITLSAFAKTVGLGPTKLFAMLRDRKILMSCRGERWNLPMQEFVDRGYFATRESTFDSNGEKRISFTPLITGKGQQWLVERFIREGVLRGVAA